MYSQLVAYGDPAVMKVVAAAKNLQVVALGHERLTDVVDFFRFLWLASPHAEDHVTVNVAFDLVTQVTFVAYKTRFFGVLKIISVALVNFSVDSLLDPHDLIDKPTRQKTMLDW